MSSTSDREARAALAVAVPRRQVLAGLAGLPVLFALGGCTGREPQPQPSGSSSASGGRPSTTPAIDPPAVDSAALGVTAADAIMLLAAYEATVAAHPGLAPVLAPYASDHDTHLEALGERITLPTSSPVGSSPATSTPPGVLTIGPSSTVPPVPIDPAAARDALVQAEEVTGATARDAARGARDGETARLLASIGASRAVHALLLGASR